MTTMTSVYVIHFGFDTWWRLIDPSSITYTHDHLGHRSSTDHLHLGCPAHADSKDVGVVCSEAGLRGPANWHVCSDFFSSLCLLVHCWWVFWPPLL